MKSLALAQLLFVMVATLAFGEEEPISHFFTTSDGVRIHYLTLGDSGSHVVLVHGYTSSARNNWFLSGVAQTLSESHRVVAIDIRNHGESQNERGSGDQRDDRRPFFGSPYGSPLEVRELFEHLGIERAHLHGYSMGGTVTMRLMFEIPERLITASFGGSGIREESKGKRFEGLDLSRIDFPVLAIHGSDDSSVDANTERMTRELRDFTSSVLPGYGHLSAVSRESGYAEILLSFLNANDKRDPRPED